MSNLKDAIKGGVDSGMPSSQGLNTPGGTVNQIERLAPHLGRPLDFRLLFHSKHREAVEREQKVFDLRQFRVELVFGRPTELRQRFFVGAA